ncbi:uncharacterized protein MONOS_3985 [Monocercomonoides exilis]|uniref:uncharacterized protein n=1 Tax=Monocercomonoides exilis TaxID=2049356 RepID=UPI00355A8161|nr:hypothetical protein MONOS_3985 [Monocercomonoides exilis]|eukprot:MONOS_3985.1-p1 / transcript=MONOS_3985.1 / gene=MONOS_3985 / organism=Monocercomonoides_exilis_PA203 / gene_product=unspecified product / transcript_product=unspecified product / location=Mono_scaffold00100:21030-22439(-) / protein_length=341 / sequence_SO=supercontig / SO=protein_coding / is_pseudo=false
MQTVSVTERYNKLFSELEDCNEDEQKEKIEKMNEVMDEMDEEELECVVTAEVFNGIFEMIEEKKLTLENAFLLLKHIGSSNALKSMNKIPEELYLSEMKEIIQHHQDHHNLTPLAYQSAWQFLMNRLFLNGVLEKVMTDELHFVKEAKREMEELAKCVDWKRKEEKRGGKGVKEGIVLRRWLFTLFDFFFSCHLWDDEYSELVCCVVRVFRSAKDNHRKYSMKCIDLLKAASEKRAVKIGGLLKGGADDAVLEGIRLPTMDYEMAYDCLRFIMNISGRLKSKDDEAGEAKGEGLKRKVVEKMEEEGYEDVIASFHVIIPFLKTNSYYFLPKHYGDYLINT